MTYLFRGVGSGIDNRATLVDYARITSAFPIVPNTETAVREAVGICQDAMRAGGGNCSLSLTWSPYIFNAAPCNEQNGSIVPVNVTTPTETMVLGVFKQFLANVANWSADASRGKLGVSLGAVLFDQEIYGDGSSQDPAIKKGTTQKNNLYYRAAKQAFPAAEIIQYNRGGWMPCGPNEPVPTPGNMCT